MRYHCHFFSLILVLIDVSQAAGVGGTIGIAGDRTAGQRELYKKQDGRFDAAFAIQEVAIVARKYGR